MKNIFKKILQIVQKVIVAAVFTVSLLLLVRFFAFDIYYVPSGSMDSTIHPQETILTNKLIYGSRWFNDSGVIRLPGFKNVERNDIVVFNFPQGDTIFVDAPLINYYTHNTDDSFGVKDAQAVERKTTYLPIQNRIAYVKRCVGLPKDSIAIVNGEIYCNGKLVKDGEGCNYRYRIKGNPDKIPSYLKYNGIYHFWKTRQSDSIYAFLTRAAFAEKLNNESFKVYRFPTLWYEKNVFTKSTIKKNDGWKYDSYGPLYIPAKGDTLCLDMANLSLYSRLIKVYEHNTLDLMNDDIVINGQITNKYIVKQDYYFMMGDNRNGSIDSRTWGFVPKDHVIGKAQVIVNSKDNLGSINWNRIGTILR